MQKLGKWWYMCKYVKKLIKEPRNSQNMCNNCISIKKLVKLTKKLHRWIASATFWSLGLIWGLVYYNEQCSYRGCGHEHCSQLWDHKVIQPLKSFLIIQMYCFTFKQDQFFLENTLSWTEKNINLWSGKEGHLVFNLEFLCDAINDLWKYFVH